MSDSWFRYQKENVIDPFHAEQVKELNGKRVLSYGVSSFGYTK